MTGYLILVDNVQSVRNGFTVLKVLRQSYSLLHWVNMIYVSLRIKKWYLNCIWLLTMFLFLYFCIVQCNLNLARNCSIRFTVYYFFCIYFCMTVSFCCKSEWYSIILSLNFGFIFDKFNLKLNSWRFYTVHLHFAVLRIVCKKVCSYLIQSATTNGSRTRPSSFFWTRKTCLLRKFKPHL